MKAKLTALALALAPFCGLALPPAPTLAQTPTKESTGFKRFATPQGTATLTNASNGLLLADDDQGADTIRAVCQPAPATPYTKTGKFTLTADFDGDSWGGFAWRDAVSGKIIGYGILAAQLGGAGGLNGIPTVFSIDFSDYVTYAGSAEGYVTTYAPTIWVQISDDGTHAIERYSMDGVNFNELTSVTKSGGYLGAGGYNQICIFVSAHGSAAKLILSDYD